MADYVTLRSRYKQWEIDDANAANNPYGSQYATLSFTPADINIQVAYFEVYKMVIHGPAASLFDVYVDIMQWDATVRGDANSWDPNQPLILRPGQSVIFYFNTAGQPNGTLWLRYDQSLSQNRSYING